MKAFIIDDETLSRDLLKVSLQEVCPEVAILGESSTIKDAFLKINETKPDVVFLDIEMPNGNGFDLLHKFEGRKPFQTVFLTAHEHYARQAIKERATDYLLKPLDKEELYKAVYRVKNNVSKYSFSALEKEELEKKVVLGHSKGISLMALKDIIKLEADNNYTVITLKNNKKLVCPQTLGKFESTISSDWFLRVHRSNIINLYYLQELLYADGGYALLSTGDKISVSDSKVNELKEWIHKNCSRIN
jgi:two-component system LytT family response regulator